MKNPVILSVLRGFLIFERKDTLKPFPVVRSTCSPKSKRELFSTLCSAASQHFAAVCRRHSFAETVFLFTMSFLRLICPEHAFFPLSPCERTLYNKHRKKVNHIFANFYFYRFVSPFVLPFKCPILRVLRCKGRFHTNYYIEYKKILYILLVISRKLCYT